MSLFYKGFTAIFVTFFAWIGPIAASTDAPSVIVESCESMVTPDFQTQIIKKAISNPIDLYRELYERYQYFFSETEPNNFPVTDLFSEDLRILKGRLENARDYLRVHNRSNYADLMEQLIARSDSMLKNGFGYVSYWNFTNIYLYAYELFIFAKMQISPESFSYLKNKRKEIFEGGDTGILTLIKHFLSGTGYSVAGHQFAIKSYYQFPLFTLPSVSRVSREDILLMSSAPLKIRYLSDMIELVDKVYLSPGYNARHDDFHGSLLAIDDSSGVHFTKRFKGIEDLLSHSKKKLSVTKHMIFNIHQIADMTERLRHDQWMFYYGHEETYSSIEYFGSNYGGALFPGGTLDTHTNPNTFFLSEADIEILKKRPLTLAIRDATVGNLQRWYQEGGGPTHPLRAEVKK